LRGILGHSPHFEVIELVANRTRDMSVSVRQEAANILSYCLTTFDGSEIVSLWFDSILPMALDADSKTQELALKLFDEHILSAIGGAGRRRLEFLSSSHLDLLRKVIPIYRQNSMNLRHVCSNLERLLDVDAEAVLWDLAEIVSGVTPEHFRGDYTPFWESREVLPPSYYSLVQARHLNDSAILGDSLAFLRAVAGLERRDARLPIIRWSVQYIGHCETEHDSEFRDLLTDTNARLNAAINNEGLSECELLEFAPSIYLLGELFAFVPNLEDFDFAGLELLIAEQLPNLTAIPPFIRSVSTLALGKLCLWRRDISAFYVAAFAHQLHCPGIAAVKCNCLIVLCDLCVRYTATVDPYVHDMSACLADESPVVRRQALLILTRLITEDYVKLRDLLFFRFAYSLVDEDDGVARFAQRCLFDVLTLKESKMLTHYLIETLLYFNDHLDPAALNEDEEAHFKFRIAEPARRKAVYKLMIEKVSNAGLFELLQDCCVRVLQTFADGTLSLDEGESLLSDTLGIMLRIEEVMESPTATEANIDDPASERIVETSRMFLGHVHDQLIKRVLPILNQTHRFLRESRSPLQSELRKLFRILCHKHPSLLDDLRKQEPTLAVELEHDIALTETPAIGASPETPPPRTPFRSPLLSRLARTPTMTAVFAQAPRPQSPMSVLSQPVVDEEDYMSQKRPPIPFSLDDDD
jgi:condensin-2 complex subunit D3